MPWEHSVSEPRKRVLTLTAFSVVAAAVMFLVVTWNNSLAGNNPFDAARAWRELGVVFVIPTVLAAAAVRFRPHNIDPAWPALITAVACGAALAARVLYDTHEGLQFFDSNAYKAAVYIRIVLVDISGTALLTTVAVLARLLWRRREVAGRPVDAEWGRPSEVNG